MKFEACDKQKLRQDLQDAQDGLSIQERSPKCEGPSLMLICFSIL